MNTVEKGKIGEEHARQYLQDDGYTILQKNFRTRRGEVDIVSTRGNLIAFVEVKTWCGIEAGDLRRVFTPAKRRRMQYCAQVFLRDNPEYSRHVIRFDLIYLRPDGSLVGFYENVLT